MNDDFHIEHAQSAGPQKSPTEPVLKTNSAITPAESANQGDGKMRAVHALDFRYKHLKFLLAALIFPLFLRPALKFVQFWFDPKYPRPEHPLERVVGLSVEFMLTNASFLWSLIVVIAAYLVLRAWKSLGNSVLPIRNRSIVFWVIIALLGAIFYVSHVLRVKTTFGNEQEVAAVRWALYGEGALNIIVIGVGYVFFVVACQLSSRVAEGQDDKQAEKFSAAATNLVNACLAAPLAPILLAVLAIELQLGQYEAVAVGTANYTTIERQSIIGGAIVFWSPCIALLVYCLMKWFEFSTYELALWPPHIKVVVGNSTMRGDCIDN